MRIEAFFRALNESTDDSDASVALFRDGEFFVVGAADPETGKAVPCARAWQHAESPEEEGIVVTVVGSAKEVKAMGEFLQPMPMRGSELLELMAQRPQWSVMLLDASGGGMRLMPEHLDYYRHAVI